MVRLLFLLTCLLGATALWPALAEARGFATDDRGRLYSVLPATKEVSKLGTVQVTTGTGKKSTTVTPSLTDLALSDLHGLYGISYTDLYKINMLDPARSKHVGALGGGVFGLFNALAFDENGVLFALQGQRLYTVNLKTGRATEVGGVGAFSSDGDLVFISGVLYGTFNGKGGCHLLRLDPTTGKGTDVGLIRRPSIRAKRSSKKPSPKKDGAGSKGGKEADKAKVYRDVWGLIWDGERLWALTPDGRILHLDRKTAVATPHYRAPVTFWGACAMLRL